MSDTQVSRSPDSAENLRRNLIGQIAGSIVQAAANRESTTAPAQPPPASGELARTCIIDAADSSALDSLADVFDAPDISPTASRPSGKPCLSNKQLQVLEVLATGVNIAQAARTTGLSRMTIHRWITGDPVVRAAYNRWRQLAHDSARNRLLALQHTAADVVFDQVTEKRDARLAMRLLERLGTLAEDTPGAADPKLAAMEAEIERLRQELELRRQKVDLAENGKRIERDELFVNR